MFGLNCQAADTVFGKFEARSQNSTDEKIQDTPNQAGGAAGNDLGWEGDAGWHDRGSESEFTP